MPDTGFADFDSADFGGGSSNSFVQQNFADFANFHPPRSSSPQKGEAPPTHTQPTHAPKDTDTKMDTDSIQPDSKVQRKFTFILSYIFQLGSIDQSFIDLGMFFQQ